MECGGGGELDELKSPILKKLFGINFSFMDIHVIEDIGGTILLLAGLFFLITYMTKKKK